MKYCKLTDENNQTLGGCQWGEMITHHTDGKGKLCGPGWIHLYTHPLLAVLLNPIHANFGTPHLWSVRTAGKTLHDRGLKVGKTVVTTVQQLPLPVITTNQRVAFAILCALEVYDNKGFEQWAAKWLSGGGRSEAAAKTATAAAWTAAAAGAGSAGARAAAAGVATAAAWTAASAEAGAAMAASWATAASEIDLIALAKRAMEIT